MAESPIITCPECRKKFKGKADLEGKKIKCPLCAKAFVVPGEKKTEAAQPTMAPESVTAAPKNLGFADEEEGDDQNPYGITDIDISPRHYVPELRPIDGRRGRFHLPFLRVQHANPRG